MNQNNLNARLRNLFTKHFLCQFIDFSRYENNPELALKHYKFSYKLVVLYALIFIFPFYLVRSEALQQNIIFKILLIAVFIGFLLVIFSMDAFKNKLSDMKLLENRDERAKLMDKKSLINDMGGMFVFILIQLPLLVLFIAGLHYFIK
jgi:hypothetical protein